MHRAVREDDGASGAQRARAQGLHGLVGAQETDERILGLGSMVAERGRVEGR